MVSVSVCVITTLYHFHYLNVEIYTITHYTKIHLIFCRMIEKKKRYCFIHVKTFMQFKKILYSSVYILQSLLLNYSISAFSYFHLTSTLFLFSSSGSWERDRARARRGRDEVTEEKTDRDKEEEQGSGPEEPQYVTTAREEIGPLLAEQRKTMELTETKVD